MTLDNLAADGQAQAGARLARVVGGAAGRVGLGRSLVVAPPGMVGAGDIRLLFFCAASIANVG